jgi:hypothetical protein
MTSTAICFWFFYFYLNIWEEFKVLSHFIQKRIQSPACWDQGLFRILYSYWLSHFYLPKNSPKCSAILVWLADCWFSSNILLTGRNPKNNFWLCRIFGARFGGKDCSLCPYNPWSQQGGWLEAFLYEAAQTFEVFSNIQNWNNKILKPIAFDVLFLHLSNGSTLTKIQSGRTVPLRDYLFMENHRKYLGFVSISFLNRGI